MRPMVEEHVAEEQPGRLRQPLAAQERAVLAAEVQQGRPVAPHQTVACRREIVGAST